MADLSIYKVDLDTPQPGGRQGESPRSAFTKYNDMLDDIRGRVDVIGDSPPLDPVPYMVWLDTTDDTLYRRNAANTAWLDEGPSGEVRYTRGNILGTVGQSGGVPTGAIIERGSNANGQYVRYADGTQICTIVGPDLVYSTAFRLAYTWTFPAAFSSTLYVGLPVVGAMSEDGQPGAADKYRGHVRVDSATTTQARFSLMSGGNFIAGDTATCRLLVVGQYW